MPTLEELIGFELELPVWYIKQRLSPSALKLWPMIYASSDRNLTVKQLSNFMRIPPRTVKRALGQLKSKGLLKIDSQGQFITYSPFSKKPIVGRIHPRRTA